MSTGIYIDFSLTASTPAASRVEAQDAAKLLRGLFWRYLVATSHL